MKVCFAYVAFLIFFLISPMHAAPGVLQTQHFLVITDVHLEQNTFHNMNLMPSMRSWFNDLDQKNFNELMDIVAEQIKTGLIPKPKFVLYLGDAVGHVRLGKQFVWKNELALFDKFTQTFPEIPIFYTFGNNDAFSKNYGSFASLDDDGQMKTPLDAAKATQKWGNSFVSTDAPMCISTHEEFPCILSQNQIDGYYAAYLEPHLRLIDLNTVMFSTHHTELSNTAIEAQLTWLEQQLQAARDNQESVLMAMHIPMGKNIYDDSYFLKSEANQHLIALIQRYHPNIIGILAAHTHMDEIKIIQDKTDRSLIGIYLTPAMSTSHGTAPAIRSYEYALLNDKWQLIDYTTFYFNKNKAGETILQKLYSYHETYCSHSQLLMNDCLSRVNAVLMEKYYTAGNAKHEHFNYPQNIYIKKMRGT